MVYTDGIHLVADTLDELHCFVKKLGFKLKWFQNHKGRPHYDLTTPRARSRAIDAGAKQVDAKQVLKISKKSYIHRISTGC